MMRKLSEYKGDDALEMLANIIEPATEIIGDAEIKKIMRDKQPLVKAVKVALKNHKSAVVEILARLDGEEPENYEVGLLTLPVKLLQVLSDKELMAVFISQTQSVAEGISGSAMESIEEAAEG